MTKILFITTDDYDMFSCERNMTRMSLLQKDVSDDDDVLDEFETYTFTDDVAPVTLTKLSDTTVLMENIERFKLVAKIIQGRFPRMCSKRPTSCQRVKDGYYVTF